MKSKDKKELRADLLLLSVAITWGVTFLMVQDAIENVPVYAFLFWRFSIATILMFLVSYKRLKHLNKETAFYGVVLGLVLFGGFATQTFGLLYISSAVVAFMTGLNVILVPFLAYLFYKDNISLNVMLGSFLALIGLYLLTSSGGFSIGFGEILVLVCALAFAIRIVLTGRFSKAGDVFLIVLFQFFTVAVLSLIFSLSLDSTTFGIEFDFVFLKAVIITSVFATFYAFLIQTHFQQYTTATKTAIIFTMEPVSAAFYGVFVGNEILTNYQLIGAFLIISATVLTEIKFRKAK